MYSSAGAHFNFDKKSAKAFTHYRFFFKKSSRQYLVDPPYIN